MLRRLLDGLAPQLAQDDGFPVVLGQPADLLVQHRQQVALDLRVGHGWFGHGGHRSFPLPAPGPARPGLESCLSGHPVEPAADLRAGVDRRRLADQDEEGGLEGVLRVVPCPQDAAADPPDHRPVAVHERLQRRRLLAAQEALQQMAVGQLRLLRQQQDAAEVLDDLADRATRHWAPHAGRSSPLQGYYPLPRGLSVTFFGRPGPPAQAQGRKRPPSLPPLAPPGAGTCTWISGRYLGLTCTAPGVTAIRREEGTPAR